MKTQVMLSIIIGVIATALLCLTPDNSTVELLLLKAIFIGVIIGCCYTPTVELARMAANGVEL